MSAAVALLAAAVRTARTARSIEAMLSRDGLGAGPQGGVIVGGADVAVAAAGVLRRPDRGDP